MGWHAEGPIEDPAEVGPAVKRGDESWTSVVRWTLNALVLAEELGVTAENADQLAEESRDPQIRRLLGAEGDLGPAMGLSREWARNAIKASGNYGEIFTRNLGPDSSLDLAQPLKGPFRAEKLAWMEEARAALQLARLAGMLPAFLVGAERAGEPQPVLPGDLAAWSDATE